MNKVIPLLAFSILLLVPVGAQNAFAAPGDIAITLGEPSRFFAGSPQIKLFDSNGNSLGTFSFPANIFDIDYDANGNLYALVDGAASGIYKRAQDGTISFVASVSGVTTGADIAISNDGRIAISIDDIFGSPYQILLFDTSGNSLPSLFVPSGAVFGMEFDTNGNLFVITGFGGPHVSMIAPDGTWSFVGTAPGGGTAAADIAISTTDVIALHRSDSFSQANLFDSNFNPIINVGFPAAIMDLDYDSNGNLFGFNQGFIYKRAPDGTVSTITGTGTFISSISQADIAVAPNAIQQIGGEIIPIETTALLLAGAQSYSWMIPVLLSVLGIGLFVFRKSENS